MIWPTFSWFKGTRWIIHQTEYHIFELVFSAIPIKCFLARKGLLSHFFNRSVNICIQTLATQQVTLYILIIFWISWLLGAWYQTKMCENAGVCTVTYCCKQLLWFRYLWWHGIYLVFVYSFLVGANEYYWFVPNRNPLWFEKLLVHILGKIGNFKTAWEGKFNTWPLSFGSCLTYFSMMWGGLDSFYLTQSVTFKLTLLNEK